MIHTTTVLVIVASMRARRIGAQVAQWVAGIGRTSLAEKRLEILDLKDWPLPMDDEPGIPAGNIYEQAHTKAFGEKIASAQGFVFVTPQYNWGYPAPLKNALDHLYKEWSGKPALIVSYGSRGGGKCAAQLQQVLQGLHMKPVGRVGLKISRDRIEANAGEIDAAAVFAPHESALRQGFARLDGRLSGRRWW
jgi:NAD(P)H-dependent FMN reductase